MLRLVEDMISCCISDSSPLFLFSLTQRAQTGIERASFTFYANFVNRSAQDFFDLYWYKMWNPYSLQSQGTWTGWQEINGFYQINFALVWWQSPMGQCDSFGNFFLSSPWNRVLQCNHHGSYSTVARQSIPQTSRWTAKDLWRSKIPRSIVSQYKTEWTHPNI